MKKLHLFTVRAVIVALLAVLGAFWGLSRLDAQEITPEATTAPLPPIVVEDGGTVIVEAPQDTPIVSNEIVLALIAVVGLLVGVVIGIRRGGSPDQVVATQIELLQQKREAMEMYERQLASANAMTQMVFGTFAGFVKLIAPLTPLLTDDAVAKFLEDLQKQGPPEAPAPSSLSQPKRID